MIFMLMALAFDVRSQAGESGAEPILFDKSQLVIIAGKTRHTFRVEIAKTDRQRRLGLMHRPSLDSDAGMLFDYGTPRPVAMWMKNTVISLDMLFIAANGRIVNIAQNTEPQSLTAIPSSGPARAVLELSAGTARRLGIGRGDRVIHEIFQP